MNINEIDDINKLKALKADQYDLLEQAQTQFKNARQAIDMVNKRIYELQLAKNEANQSQQKD